MLCARRRWTGIERNGADHSPARPSTVTRCGNRPRHPSRAPPPRHVVAGPRRYRGSMASSGDDGEPTGWPGSTEGTSHWPAPLPPSPPPTGAPPQGAGVPGPATRSSGGWWIVFAALGFVIGQVAALIIIAVA